MRCPFFKSDSTASRSIEHIIPESLGNMTQILPPGVVCDGCNNYFSRKVEGPCRPCVARDVREMVIPVPSQPMYHYVGQCKEIVR
jgi:hypothetical protein